MLLGRRMEEKKILLELKGRKSKGVGVRGAARSVKASPESKQQVGRDQGEREVAPGTHTTPSDTRRFMAPGISRSSLPFSCSFMHTICFSFILSLLYCFSSSSFTTFIFLAGGLLFNGPLSSSYFLRVVCSLILLCLLRIASSLAISCLPYLLSSLCCFFLYNLRISCMESIL